MGSLERGFCDSDTEFEFERDVCRKDKHYRFGSVLCRSVTSRHSQKSRLTLGKVSENSTAGLTTTLSIFGPLPSGKTGSADLQK